MKLRDLQEKFSDTREDQIARAEALGFDTSRVWYHGTDKKIAKFKLGSHAGNELGAGVYLATDAMHAGMWARTIDGGNMLPCFIRKGPIWNWTEYERADPKTQKKMLLPTMKAWAAYLNGKFVGKENTAQNQYARWTRDGRFSFGTDQNEVLSKAGYIGAIKPDSQVPSQICVFRPEDVRSIFAKFQKPEGKLSESMDEKFIEDARMKLRDLLEAAPSSGFKKFITGTKVLDQRGKPLMVFHGGHPGYEKLNAFSFFSDRPELALNYIRNKKVRPHNGQYWLQSDHDPEYYTSLDHEKANASHGFYRCYLSMKNPLVLDAKYAGWREIPVPPELSRKGGTMQIDPLAGLAKKKGYDGLIVHSVVDQWGHGTQFVVFNSKQVWIEKS